VVNFSALRHSPKHPDFYEDPIPLTDVAIEANLPARVTSAQAVIAGQDVSITTGPNGAMCFTLSRVTIHEIVALTV
jgi:hypothetical protein